MEETIQKNLNQNREMIERIPLKDKKNWKDKLDFNFYEDGIIRVTIENKEIKSIIELYSFVESLLAEQKKELMKEERQFIINVLDGIDIADKQMGVIGGTQAIRQALKNRVI